MADRSIILRLKVVTSREPTDRRSEGRAMIAGLLLVAGIFVAFQGGGWLLLGLILIAAGLGHALMGRDPRSSGASRHPRPAVTRAVTKR